MKLKVYLVERDMTIKDFAESIDVHYGHLSGIINGRLKPGKRLARDIEEATGGLVKLLDEKNNLIQK